MSEPLTLEKTAFVTFYSFKGGVGRSMALINVAGIMAGRGFRVLAMDMDLEAPGISYLMRHEANLDGQLLPGFVDLLSDACERGEEADLFALKPQEVVERYTYAYTVPEPIRQSEEGVLRIMPAGQFDNHYQQRLDQLDLGQLYREGQGQPLIAALKHIISSAGMFDIVFIDSRTGFSDESGICTRDLGDHLVVIMGLNRQNQEGTAAFLRSLRVSGNESKPLQIVLSPVPNGEDELLEKREAEATQVLTEVLERHVELNLQIPYHPRLALTEEPHIFRRSRGYLYKAYAEIEKATLALLGITQAGLHNQISDSAKKRKMDDVLHNLRLLCIIDPSGGLLDAMFSGDLLEFCYNDEARMVREFLVEKLPDNSWVARRMAAYFHDKKNIEAEFFYRKFVKSDSMDSVDLGNFADFIVYIRNDPDEAETLYQRAIDAEPSHPFHHSILVSYANLLAYIRMDYDKAEVFYRRAIEAGSSDAASICSYADFLASVRKNRDKAEAHYRRALKTDPSHPRILRSYANFLKIIRREYNEAEELYRKALDADPRNPVTLGNFAEFLVDIRKDYKEAEALYRRAIEADPYDANLLGNFAKLLFVIGDDIGASQLVAEALAQKSDNQALQCELHFYGFCHLWESCPASLEALKKLLAAGARSEDWPLDENVRVGIASGHPHPEFLQALAAVVSAKAEIGTLDRFEIWQKS